MCFDIVCGGVMYLSGGMLEGVRFVYHVSEFLEPGKRVSPIILRGEARGQLVQRRTLSSGRTKHIDISCHYI